MLLKTDMQALFAVKMSCFMTASKFSLYLLKLTAIALYERHAGSCLLHKTSPVCNINKSDVRSPKKYWLCQAAFPKVVYTCPQLHLVLK